MLEKFNQFRCQVFGEIYQKMKDNNLESLSLKNVKFEVPFTRGYNIFRRYTEIFIKNNELFIAYDVCSTETGRYIEICKEELQVVSLDELYVICQGLEESLVEGGM